jgi:16S rRNA (adenine1518-N6/adenine1519-N6)-dimethyltransferase
MSELQRPLREVISTHGLSARKAMGQHFLLDMNLTRKIVREAGDLTGQTVIEIGPGPGGLTRALLEGTAKTVIAIEKDKRFIEALQPLAEESEGRLRIIEADALEIDPVEITPAPRRIIANLPYNVGTLLFTSWLQRAHEYDQLVLMFQKEVADRIVADVGDKAYGRLSILARFCGTPESVMHIPARAFTPPPKVDSSVLRFTPHKTPFAFDLALLEKITAKAFGQRRKMLRAIFRGELDESAFAKLGLKPEMRPENLSVSQYIELAKHLAAVQFKS